MSGDQYAQHGALESASGFATGEGEGDISASDAFMKAILSGDPTKVAQVLAPQISAQNKTVQQDQKTGAMNGNRAGGTNANSASAVDKAHSDRTNATAGAASGAAGALGSEGSGLLGEGMSGNDVGFQQAGAIQQQKLAKFNDIMNSTAAVAAAPFTGGASLTGLTSNGGKGMSGGFSMPGGGGAAPEAAQNPDIANWLSNNGPVPASTDWSQFDTTAMPDLSSMFGG